MANQSVPVWRFAESIMRVSCVMCHACVMYNVSYVICNVPSSMCQLRIVSGLLCDKPWCDPVILTTVAVGLGKK